VDLDLMPLLLFGLGFPWVSVPPWLLRVFVAGGSRKVRGLGSAQHLLVRFSLHASSAVSVNAGTCLIVGWASIVNSVNEVGVPDIVLTTIVLGLFGVGFTIGIFKYARVAGILFLAIEGGISIGLRVVLTRPNLLIPNANLYALNWLIIAAFGVAGGLSLVLNRRVAIVCCLTAIFVLYCLMILVQLGACTSTGTFLLALGADLILERQSGISRGLRFFMDKNDNHAAVSPKVSLFCKDAYCVQDIIQHGYSPPLTTLIIILASLGLMWALRASPESIADLLFM
jgi:hypothetical protein